MTQRLAYVVAAILILTQGGPASAAPLRRSNQHSRLPRANSACPRTSCSRSLCRQRWETDTQPSAAAGTGRCSSSTDRARLHQTQKAMAERPRPRSVMARSIARHPPPARPAAEIKTNTTQNIRAVPRCCDVCARYRRRDAGGPPSGTAPSRKYSSSDEASVALASPMTCSQHQERRGRTTSTGDRDARGHQDSPDTSTRALSRSRSQAHRL